MILKLSYYHNSFSWEIVSLAIIEDCHQSPLTPKSFRKYWRKKRRCISPPNLACLFPINSGHSVKMSTPGHLMSGHLVSVREHISQCILASLLFCQSESDRRSDFALTEYETTCVYNRVLQMLAVCGLMSCHFLWTSHCQSKWVNIEMLFTSVVLVGSVLSSRDNDNWVCS